MKRRDFIFNSVVAGVALGTQACHTDSKPDAVNHQPIAKEFELSEVNIPYLQSQMEKGVLTSEKITRLYLERIELLDQSGPQVNAVIEINPKAIEIAVLLDKERKEGKVRGPLHGIPVLIKDNIDTGDQMSTSAGSLALGDHKASVDAFIVKKLREAGMVLLGKTNLSEWANFRSSGSSSGWSGRGGQTRNPYVLDRTPCGSSSGSGAAVSANFAAITIGTETDGSIVCPAGINGVVGIKPTVGLWSRSGIVPISESQDTAGPMARSVKDAALLLRALTGKDVNDKATLDQPDDFEVYLHFDEFALSGSKIGYIRSMSGFDKRVSTIMDEVVDTLKNKGADIVEIDEVDMLSQLGEAEWLVLLCEFKDGLNRYLSNQTSLPYESLAELIAFNKENKDDEMRWFGQEVFELAEATKGKADPRYKDALAKCKQLSQKEGIDKLVDEHKLDCLMAPTNGAAWVVDWINGDHFRGGSSTLAAVAGYPSITVPAGNIHGLPIGVSFFGKAWSESRLIQLAYAYEKASKKRIVPQFTSSLM